MASQANLDVHKAYWQNRFGYTNTTHSLRGITIDLSEQGGCFSAGTKVLMKNGENKNIEDIKRGENILTFDNDLNKLVSAQVKNIHQTIAVGHFLINKAIRVTGNHLLLVNGTWQRADKIKIGDELYGVDKKKIKVNEIKWIKNRERVYNLIIKDRHTFIADGYLVHNGKGGADFRAIFKDVAYWNPHIQTDKNGKATVKFTLPDDLTTWVLTAVGATKKTIVGNGEAEILVNKPVIIRPQLPNIIRAGDKIFVSAYAHNNLNKTQTFVASLKVKNGVVKDAKQQIKIPAGEFRVISWEVSAIKNKKIVAFTFHLADKHNKKNSDTIYKEIPVEEFGFWEADSSVGIGDKEYNITINPDAFNNRTVVKLTLASTSISSLSSAMKYLIHYPYGCMEQTVSAFMPIIIAKEQPQFFAKALEGKEVDKMIDGGVRRLANKQTKDGGWSWWGGESNLFLSTYVTEYLLRAKKLGNSVDEEMLSRAKAYFENKKYQKQNRTDKILVTYGQALFGRKNDKEELKTKKEDDTDLIAMALIANVRNGFTNQSTNGYETLLAKMEHHGNTAYWSGGDKNRFGTIDASTGIALKALLLAGVDKNKAVPILQYFLTTRKKEYWSNTFATAQILESFAIFNKQESLDQEEEYTTKIFVDGKLFDTKVFNRENTLVSLDIPINKIKKNGTVISLKTNKPNNYLYSTLLTKQYHTSTEVDPVSKTISLERKYEKINGEGGPLKTGDEVMVKFTVKGLHKEDRYFMLEDQLPSGLVPLNEHLNNATDYDRTRNKWDTNKEYTKNGVIITDNYIDEAGDQHYSYRAYVASAGEYQVPPSQAMLMYRPEIYAHSGSRIMKIEKKKYDYKTEKITEKGGYLKKIFSDKINTALIKLLSFSGIFIVIALGAVLIYRKYAK